MFSVISTQCCQSMHVACRTQTGRSSDQVCVASSAPVRAEGASTQAALDAGAAVSISFSKSGLEHL